MPGKQLFWLAVALHCSHYVTGILLRCAWLVHGDRIFINTTCFVIIWTDNFNIYTCTHWSVFIFCMLSDSWLSRWSNFISRISSCYSFLTHFNQFLNFLPCRLFVKQDTEWVRKTRNPFWIKWLQSSSKTNQNKCILTSGIKSAWGTFCWTAFGCYWLRCLFPYGKKMICIVLHKHTVSVSEV